MIGAIAGLIAGCAGILYATPRAFALHSPYDPNAKFSGFMWAWTWRWAVVALPIAAGFLAIEAVAS